MIITLMHSLPREIKHKIAKKLHPEHAQNENGRSPTSHSPPKEIIPKMNSKRNNKFHNLFKDMPAEESCLKGYSCAYIGDILIQGNLYITANWFCFHSRILGIERQIRIKVSDVLNITREKTAIFIPNAVGVVTSEDKYVFGSLLSRDSTFRLMFSVWETLLKERGRRPGVAPPEVHMAVAERLIQQSEPAQQQAAEAAAGALTRMRQEQASVEDSSGSEDSVCISCGLPVAEHDGQAPCSGVGDDALTDDTFDAPPTPSGGVAENEAALTSTPEQVAPASAAAGSDSDSAPTSLLSSVSSVDGRLATVMRRVLGSGGARLQPKTHLLLSICFFMVFVLAVSAVIMLYKIVLLQAHLDGSQMTSSSFSIDSQSMHSNMYYLNQEYHMTSIKRFHSVLEANINVLDQIFHSLRGLQSSIQHAHVTASGATATCESGQCDDVIADDGKTPTS